MVFALTQTSCSCISFPKVFKLKSSCSNSRVHSMGGGVMREAKTRLGEGEKSGNRESSQQESDERRVLRSIYLAVKTLIVDSNVDVPKNSEGNINLTADQMAKNLPGITSSVLYEGALDEDVKALNDRVKTLEQQQAEERVNVDQAATGALDAGMEAEILGVHTNKEFQNRVLSDPQMLRKTMAASADTILQEHFNEGKDEKGTSPVSGEGGSEYIPPMDVKQMEAYLMNWAKRNERPVAEEALKAISQHLVTQKYIPINSIGYVFYGWEIRGDHNMIEIKNTLTALNENTSTQLAERKAFKKDFVAITDELRGQMAKVLDLVPKPTPRSIQVPPIIPTKVPTAGGPSPLRRNMPIIESMASRGKNEQHVQQQNEEKQTVVTEETRETLRYKVAKVFEISGQTAEELKIHNTKASKIVVSVADELSLEQLEKMENSADGKATLMKILMSALYSKTTE